MATEHPDRLVADYLRRLEAAAAALPSPRRVELVAEIRAHVADALREAGASDEVTVRNVLERLGPPEEIAAAAGSPPAAGPAAGPAAAPGRAGPLEIVALVLLTVGGVVPILGWAAGLVLASLSGVWTAREKALGLLLVLLMPPILGLLLHLIPGEGGLGTLEYTIVLWLFAAGLPTSIYLGWRLQRRRPAGSEGAPAPAGVAGA